ncbi:hypothetical protein, partial [Streptococcus pyogenes]|uniref:hypothetical protein n=1 Tax=Streptococcus pyogenes TaxID=1314 RepID=UPI001CA37776
KGEGWKEEKKGRGEKRKGRLRNSYVCKGMKEREGGKKKGGRKEMQEEEKVFTGRRGRRIKESWLEGRKGKRKGMEGGEGGIRGK